MKEKKFIIILVYPVFIFIISLASISSAMVGPEWSPEAHRLWLMKRWIEIGIIILM